MESNKNWKGSYAFILTYIKNTNLHQTYIRLSPERFRGEIYRLSSAEMPLRYDVAMVLSKFDGGEEDGNHGSGWSGSDRGGRRQRRPSSSWWEWIRSWTLAVDVTITNAVYAALTKICIAMIDATTDTVDDATAGCKIRTATIDDPIDAVDVATVGTKI